MSDKPSAGDAGKDKAASLHTPEATPSGESDRKAGDFGPGARSEALDALKKRVDDLEAEVKKPFYRDRSFWIGITTIPIIFASGWLLKFATDRPFLLREIHRLLGTEPALVAALDERHNAFKDAIQSLKPG